MAIKVSGSTVVDDNKVFLPNNTAEVSTTATITSGTLSLDLNSSGVFAVTLNANVTSLTITNNQSSGRASSFALVTIGDGNARAFSWPVSFRWPNNQAPTITSTLNKKDVYVFFTTDGGSSWQAFISGQNL
jgi:hypothetical protein